MKKIVLWKLGSLEHRILPTQEAVEKFTKILEGAKDALSAQDVAHMIWDDTVSVQVIEIGEGDIHALQVVRFEDLKSG